MIPVMPMDEMRDNAASLANTLKALAHRDRLLLMCRLSAGEASVGELVEATGLRQSSVSQHLATLREVGAVAARSNQQSRIYSIADRQMRRMFEALCITCAGGQMVS